MLKYKDYKLIQPNKDQVNMINELIESQNGSIFHEVELNRIVEKQFDTDFYYLVDDPLDIQNASPIHITKNKFGLKKYYLKPLSDIPYAGFVGKEILDLKYLSLGFFESYIYQGFPFEQKIANNLKGLKIGLTSIVDLSLNEDDIFNKIIHSKRRNMIRKALKVGISIKKYFLIEGLNVFWPILEELHKKLGYSQLSLDYYIKIFQNYASKKQAFILIAYKKGQPISGVFILGNKNYMHYYKGASLSNVKNEGQGELLQWEAIKIARKIGSKYYDLCNLEKDELPAIYRFKTGISNDIYQYPIYSKKSIGFKYINKILTLLL